MTANENSTYVRNEGDKAATVKDEAFVENEAFGEKEAEDKPENSIHRFRQLCGSIINNDRVQYTILFMITVNAIMMGIGTYDFVLENESVNNAFEKTDLAFLWIFTIEIAMQFIYHGFKLFYQGWLVFDLVIVVLSWSFQSMQVIRAFRILRALRIITRVQDLRNLVAALFDAAPRLVAIILLLVLVFYIFAVMFTNLFKDLQEEAGLTVNYFGRLDFTLFSLFRILTLNWAYMCRDTMTVYPWAWAPFMAFLMISTFIALNLMVAVICDCVALLHEEDDKEEENKEEDELKTSVSHLSSNVDELRGKHDKMKESLDILTGLLSS